MQHEPQGQLLGQRGDGAFFLELEDGTHLVQLMAILNYIGGKYNLLPEDPLDRYWGESFAIYAIEDFFIGKVAQAIYRAPEDQREGIKAEIISTHLPALVTKLDARL